MPENLGVDLIINLNKLSNFFTAPLLTVLVLVFILFRNGIAKAVVNLICKMLDVDKSKVKTKNRMLKLFIVSLGVYFLCLIWTKNTVLIRRVEKVTAIIGIFTLAMLISFFINPEILGQNKNYFNITEENFLLKKFLINICKIVIYIVATFLSFSVIGINLNGLMAGLGVGSAIIALAVQDVFKNIIAGSSIIAEKPFIIGDFIALEGGDFSKDTSGTVEDISLRSTTIRRLDNSLLNIPNSAIAANLVNNITTITNRRVEFNLNMPTYLNDGDLERIKNKIKMVFSNDSKVMAETLVIALNKISSDGYNFLVYCYINESRYIKYLEQQDKMLRQIIEIMKSENIEFQNKNINIRYLDEMGNSKRRLELNKLKSSESKKVDTKEEKEKKNIKVKNKKNEIKIRNM